MKPILNLTDPECEPSGNESDDDDDDDEQPIPDDDVLHLEQSSWEPATFFSSPNLKHPFAILPQLVYD